MVSPWLYNAHGFADERVRVQLMGTGVHFHVAYPMDTETPGFVEENRTKVTMPAGLTLKFQASKWLSNWM